MSQKPYMWNRNNPLAYEDPSGYESGPTFYEEWKMDGGQPTSPSLSAGIYVTAEATIGPAVVGGAVTVGKGGFQVFGIWGPGIGAGPVTTKAKGGLVQTLTGVLRNGTKSKKALLLGSGKAFMGGSITNGLILSAPGTATDKAFQSINTSKSFCAEFCVEDGQGKGSLQLGGGLGSPGAPPSDATAHPVIPR
jgi:hypothetical protein